MTTGNGAKNKASAGAAAGAAAVVIVNYGTAERALRAAASVLERGHGGRPVEVHLVDNASPGDDGARLSEAIRRNGWLEQVTLYFEPENRGFGAGNNRVLRELVRRAAPPDYAFLLNPDAALQNEAITELAGFLDRHPGVAVAGPRIADMRGRAVPSAFRFPSPGGEFLRGLNFGPVDRLLGRRPFALPPDTPSGPVDWVSGAAMMVRLDALRAVGFFDPAYFLHYEEVDLMRRLAGAGWETWFVPTAAAAHEVAASTGVRGAERKRRPAWFYASWRVYFRKHHGRAGALGAGLSWMAGAGLNLLVSGLRGRDPSAPPFFFRDFWNAGLRPLLGFGGGGRSSHD